MSVHESASIIVPYDIVQATRLEVAYLIPNTETYPDSIYDVHSVSNLLANLSRFIGFDWHIVRRIVERSRQSMLVSAN